MSDRQIRRYDLSHSDNSERVYSKTHTWMWIGVTVLVVLLMLWLTIFEYWQA